MSANLAEISAILGNRIREKPIPLVKKSPVSDLAWLFGMVDMCLAYHEEFDVYIFITHGNSQGFIHRWEQIEKFLSEHDNTLIFVCLPARAAKRYPHWAHRFFPRDWDGDTCDEFDFDEPDKMEIALYPEQFRDSFVESEP